MATSAVLTSYYDERNDPKKPVWEAKATLSWYTGDGHAAQEVDIANLNGRIQQIIVEISSVTGDPDVTTVLYDSDDNQLYTTGAKDDGATYVTHFETSTVAPIVINGGLTINVDPSADPGGTAQTLTVIVTIRGV